MRTTGKPIGLLLLLLSVQFPAGRGIAAKNSFRSIHTSLKAKSAQLRKPELAQTLVCPAQLVTRIDSMLDLPQLSRSHWGILIQTSSGSHTIYSRNAQQYFVPASNAKLLTTASALHQLGSQFRIRTSVYGSGDGSLHMVGRGDPSLTDAQLRELAQQLSRQGIRQVSQLIAKDDYFRGSAVNSSWEWGDIQVDYGAAVNSLILNQNAVMLKLLPQALGQPLRAIWADPTDAMRWRIENDTLTSGPTEPASIIVSRNLAGSVLQITGHLGVNSQPESVALAVLEPGKNFLQHFRRILAAEGVTVAQALVAAGSENKATYSYTQLLNLIRVHLRPSAFRELAAIESPPLSQLLVETNQNSNNLYAEALLRTLGVNINNSPATIDSIEAGLRAERATLTELGVDPGGYVLADGSGLSRHNLVSPEAIVQTLKAMSKSPEALIYRASLPVAGISGTLGNRFHDTPAQGILQAKTGTMSGISAISGYLDAPYYEPLVFSIIVNQSSQSAATLRQAIDGIVLLLTQLHRC